MPLYEFRCETCGHEFEELIPMMFATITKCSLRCPKCGKQPVVHKPPLIANTPAKWGENGARESLSS